MVPWPQLTSLTSCSNPRCPILLASAGGMQVGCRSWSISAAGQAFGRPCDTSFCPLQPLANVSTRSGCWGQAWCCYTPSLPAPQPGLAHLPPTWVGNALPTQPSSCACQLSSLEEYLDFQLFPLPA